jgi:tetratricopeptide (TPR) repeat protein
MAEPLVAELLETALERRRMVFDALALLLPYDLPDERKVLIGAPGHSGWVLVDRLRPSQPVVSVAAGASGEFEAAMAARGHAVHLVDPAAAPEAGQCWLAAGLARLPAGADAPILKFDRKGAEWDLLAAAPADVLARFEQIALGISFAKQIGNPAFNGQVQSVLRNLTRHFTLCHVRADPTAEINILGGFPVLASLDLTYVRSDLVERVPSTTVYPTPIDGSDGRQHWPEQPLWFFPFAPGSATWTLPDDREVRPPALPLSSTDVIALNNAGLALHDLGRRYEALRHFDRALELTPGVPTILFNRGNTLVALERSHDALVSYDEALAREPDNIGLLNNRACALANLGRYPEALACLDKAAALNPGDATTQANRQVVLQAAG